MLIRSQPDGAGTLPYLATRCALAAAPATVDAPATHTLEQRPATPPSPASAPAVVSQQCKHNHSDHIDGGTAAFQHQQQKHSSCSNRCGSIRGLKQLHRRTPIPWPHPIPCCTRQDGLTAIGDLLPYAVAPWPLVRSWSTTHPRLILGSRPTCPLVPRPTCPLGPPSTCLLALPPSGGEFGRKLF